jgi:hypothetical protein
MLNIEEKMNNKELTCTKCGKLLGRHAEHLMLCLDCTFKGYEKRGEFPFD